MPGERLKRDVMTISVVTLIRSFERLLLRGSYRRGRLAGNEDAICFDGSIDQNERVTRGGVAGKWGKTDGLGEVLSSQDGMHT